MGEHDGVTGVTFDSGGYRLVAALHLARGVHCRDDAWVSAEQATRLAAAAGRPRRYVTVAGANHSFAWHRAELRHLVTGWLDEVFAREER